MFMHCRYECEDDPKCNLKREEYSFIFNIYNTLEQFSFIPKKNVSH